MVTTSVIIRKTCVGGIMFRSDDVDNAWFFSDSCAGRLA